MILYQNNASLNNAIYLENTYTALPSLNNLKNVFSNKDNKLTNIKTTIQDKIINDNSDNLADNDMSINDELVEGSIKSKAMIRKEEKKQLAIRKSSRSKAKVLKKEERRRKKEAKWEFF